MSQASISRKFSAGPIRVGIASISFRGHMANTSSRKTSRAWRGSWRYWLRRRRTAVGHSARRDRRRPSQDELQARSWRAIKCRDDSRVEKNGSGPVRPVPGRGFVRQFDVIFAGKGVLRKSEDTHAPEQRIDVFATPHKGLVANAD